MAGSAGDLIVVASGASSDASARLSGDIALNQERHRGDGVELRGGR